MAKNSYRAQGQLHQADILEYKQPNQRQPKWRQPIKHLADDIHDHLSNLTLNGQLYMATKNINMYLSVTSRNLYLLPSFFASSHV